MDTSAIKYLPPEERTTSASGITVSIGHALHPKDEVTITPLAPLAPVPEKVPAPTVGARYRHKKRGSIYTVVAIATGQCSGNDRIEGQKFVCYTNEAGESFIRPWREFRDGRFTLLSAAETQSDA